MFSTRHSLTLLALLAFSCQVQAVPKVPLKKALRLAEAHLAKNRVENTHRYLQSVTWLENLQHPEKSCWVVFWAPDDSELIVVDGQLVVWVCNDGKSVRHQDTWA